MSQGNALFLRLPAHGLNRRMALFAAAAVFLLPLVLAPRIFFYYDITPKIAILLLMAAAGLLAFAAQLQGWRAFVKTRWGRWFLVAASASLGIAAFAASQSAEPELAWLGSNWRRMGVITDAAILIAALWIAQSTLRSSRHLDWLLRAVCAAGVLSSLYGIAQYFGFDRLLPRDAYSVGEGVFRIVRPPGTLGHSDYFAAWLVWPVFAGWASAAGEKGLWRWNAVAAAIFGSVAAVLSGSRGALLGLACGVAVRMLLKPAQYRNVGMVSGAAAAIFAIFYLSPAGERLRARVHWVQEDAIGGARLLLWRDSLAMASHKPFTGYGPEAFSAEFPKFESVDLARAYPDFYHESPHNLLLDVLTGSGVLGLAALAAMIVFAVRGGLAARNTRPSIALAFLPSLAANLVAQQFAVWVAPTAFFFYLSAAILAAGDAARDDREPVRISAVWRVAALAFGLAGALLLGVHAYRLLIEDHLLATVDRRLDSGDLTGAVEAYRAALGRPAAGVTADLYFSRRWSKAAMASRNAMPLIYYSQVAAGAATRATRQPEQLANAWYNLSVLAAARGDAAGAEYSLRQAIAAAPNWYKPHWILARLLAGEGRPSQASSEAARALELDAGKDPEVAYTLAQILRSAPVQP